MKNILGVALCEVRGLLEDLNKKLSGESWEKWFEELKKFLRGEPCWAEEMIPKPLESSGDLGQVFPSFLEEYISLRNKEYGPGWRLPSYKEMHRMLEVGKLQSWIYYYTSEVEECNNLRVIRRHNAGLGSSCSTVERSYLCLVRDLKLPE
jgi:hypothetical protein